MPDTVVLDHLTYEDGQLFHDRRGRAVPVPEPLAPLADTHGHLTAFRQHDPALAIARAALAGVRLLVAPLDVVDEIGDPALTHEAPMRWPSASALLSWLDEQVQIACECLDEAAEGGHEPPAFEGYDAPPLTKSIYFVAGAHPYGAASFDDAAEERLRELVADPRCVGVGEIGLDYGPYNRVDPVLQLECFRRQLRVAHELGLPVELHLRDAAEDARHMAHRDAARLLQEEGVPARGCDLHCFTSDVRVMEDFTRLGCHVAFGGALTFSRSDAIREAAAFCPERKLLSETDSPFMAPVPLRGEECEPAMVAFTVARLADVREEQGRATRQATYDALWANARAFFGL